MRRRRASSINSTRCCHPVLAKSKSKSCYGGDACDERPCVSDVVANPDLGGSGKQANAPLPATDLRPGVCRAYAGLHHGRRRAVSATRRAGPRSCKHRAAELHRRGRSFGMSLARQRSWCRCGDDCKPLRRQEASCIMPHLQPTRAATALLSHSSRYLRRRIDLQLAGRRDPDIRLRSLQGDCGLESLISNRDYFGIECPGRPHTASSIKASRRMRTWPFPFEHLSVLI